MSLHLPRWQTYLEHAQSVPETDPPLPSRSAGACRRVLGRGIASQEPDQDDVQDADPEFVLTHPRVFSGAQVARAVLAGRKDTPQ